MRLGRLLVDYLLREGLSSTAALVADDLHMAEFADHGVVAGLRKIDKALRARDCAPALAFCSENRTRLARNQARLGRWSRRTPPDSVSLTGAPPPQSTLEMSLRVQEFVELIRSGRSEDALKHARTHFPAQAEHIGLVKRSMALLVFGVGADVEPYRHLLDESRWDELADEFMRDALAIFGFAPRALMATVLLCGLSALNVPCVILISGVHSV